MTVFTDFKTLLETLGYKVFANRKIDSVKTAITYTSVSQRIVGSMSGNGGLNVERVQVSMFAINVDTLKTMAAAVENLLSCYNSSTLTIIPTENKLESYDGETSTYFIHRDFYLIY